MRRGFLLPLFFGTYSLAYLDRANFGFGAAAGLAHTLGITESRTALLSALFFLGYFAFQIPGMLWVRRVSPTRLVFVALLMWGVLAALTGVIRSFAWLAVDRLLLGVAESVVFPAMLLLLTRWFTRAERSRANTVLILGNPLTVLWMSAITGYLIQRFGWQRTFVYEGLPALLWAFVWVLLMRDAPNYAPWMAREEASALEAAIAADRPASLPGDTSLVRVLLRADVLLLSLQFFCWSLGAYGFVLWLPTMVRRGAGLGMGQTGLLTAVPYVLAVVLMLIVSHRSDRSGQRIAFIWPLLLLGGGALLASVYFVSQSFALAFVCMVVAGGCMYAPYGPFFSIIPERVPAAVTGEVFAMVNSVGALGGFAGSYLVGWLQAVTHSQRAGLLLMALALVAAGVLQALLPLLGKARIAETASALAPEADLA
ncbi:MFS transporter [Terriglobus aquaticus]|uniref:MFS transporter n=1 Tax=Terriglobus aquaticus TaxID=940139 RepID=A0ABW9KFB2_9BACT|nr:MFS transporter [Terriglobus aquaticus]